MRWLKFNRIKTGIFLGLLMVLSSGALTQAGNEPVWFNSRDAPDGRVYGFGGGADFSAAVLSALGDLAGNLETRINTILVEAVEGSRQTSRQQFGPVVVIDTMTIMSYPSGDRITDQTQIIFKQGKQRYLALQTLTSIADLERDRWQIIADNCSINDVLDALRAAGIDIKKQVVPGRAGYQFYVRLSTSAL